MSYKKTIEKSFFLKYLGMANKTGIYALINIKAKKIYIGASRYVLSDAGRVISDLYSSLKCPYKDMKKDRRQLSLLLLETTPYLQVSKWEWMDKYKAMGYDVYNDVQMPKYTVTTHISLKGKTVDVRLVSAGRRVFTVKRFKSDDEATDYINTHTIYDMLKGIR